MKRRILNPASNSTLTTTQVAQPHKEHYNPHQQQMSGTTSTDVLITKEVNLFKKIFKKN